LSPDSELITAVINLERRAVVELRADQTTITGHAVVFDTRSADLGGFVEIVRPTAVARALQPGADVRALYNHDPGAVLGRTPKTLTLATDDRGLAFTLAPAPTSAGRDAFALVQRGDVTGASFGFRTLKDAWHQDGRVIVRELLDVEIFEISLTAFPSYQATDVSVALRSMPVKFTLQSSGELTPQRGFKSASIAMLRRQLRMR
jgi:HK97 family phage prohead protease